MSPSLSVERVSDAAETAVTVPVYVLFVAALAAVVVSVSAAAVEVTGAASVCPLEQAASETVIAAAMAPQRIRFFFISITPVWVGVFFEYSYSIPGTDDRTLKKACKT